VNDHSNKRRRLFLICLLAVGVAGCAYFNTLYNAKSKFRKAKEIPVAKDGEITRQQESIYEEVIKKCEQLITGYPDSKWVDDAILLIGKAFYEKQDYDEAIRKFNELKENFPESDLNAEGQYYLSKSLLEDEKIDQAVPVMRRFTEKHVKSKYMEEILFLLGTTLMKAGESEDAAGFLDQLSTKYPKSRFKIEADLEMAEFYLEKEEPEKSLEVYQRLVDFGLKDELQIRCLSKLAETQISLGNFNEALVTLDRLREMTLLPRNQASELLLRGEAYLGIDSVQKAIGQYRRVRGGFPSSAFSAEALFRLGIIFQERMDSLELARDTFDKVPKQFPQSPFAKEAIKRSINIANLIKFSQSTGEESDEQKAETQFKLAELQFFQFSNTDQALVEYQKVIDEFGESDLAPMAMYSIAYIYQSVMGDSVKATETYQGLLERYPDSQQAEYAREFLQQKGAVREESEP
jgi:TolA-binding protein